LLYRGYTKKLIEARRNILQEHDILFQIKYSKIKYMLYEFTMTDMEACKRKKSVKTVYI